MQELQSSNSAKSNFLLITSVLIFWYVLAFVLPWRLFNRLIAEDGIIESLTALLLLMSSVAFFLIFIRPKKHLKRPHGLHFNTYGRRYSFLLLACIFLFGFGEEISWGQRIFNFDTPDFIANRNTQKELTIHNLELFDGKDLSGKPKTILMRLLTMKQLFLYFFFSFLVLVPFLNRRSRTMNLIFKKLYVPLASIHLGGLFVVNFLVYAAIRILVQHKTSSEFMHGITEIQELNFSIILFLLPFTWLYLRRQRN